MCIITDQVIRVNSTKILVGSNGDRQITVYSNNVENKIKNNCMVLPVPNPESIKFLDLSNYKNLFEDLEGSFYDPEEEITFCDDSPRYLQVFEVGSYNVSLAMNVKDVSKLDPEYFSVKKDVMEELEKHYGNKKIGFVVCKLKTGNENYHPIGYTHKILEEEGKGRIFIPTRHYHSEDKNPFVYKPTFGEEWDHDIYVINSKTNIPNNFYDNTHEFFEHKVDFKKLGFLSEKQVKQFKKYIIMGDKPNQDFKLVSLGNDEILK